MRIYITIIDYKKNWKFDQVSEISGSLYLILRLFVEISVAQYYDVDSRQRNAFPEKPIAKVRIPGDRRNPICFWRRRIISKYLRVLREGHRGFEVFCASTIEITMHDSAKIRKV